MIRFDILTVFPEMFASPCGCSLLKKAADRGLIAIHLHDIRIHAEDRHRMTDDAPYGGGGGMVMKVEPIDRTLQSVPVTGEDVPIVLMTPQGERFCQKMAEELAGHQQIILVCGHYEGVDERVRTHLATREISIGDYVLTGGELSAMVIVDAVSRLVPGCSEIANPPHRTRFRWGFSNIPTTRGPPRIGDGRFPRCFSPGTTGRSRHGGAGKPS